MADEIDRAQYHNELYQQQAMDAHYRKCGVGAYDHTPESGICIDCDSPIAPARLRVNPAALRCIDCQRRFERTA